MSGTVGSGKAELLETQPCGKMVKVAAMHAQAAGCRSPVSAVSGKGLLDERPLKLPGCLLHSEVRRDFGFGCRSVLGTDGVGLVCEVGAEMGYVNNYRVTTRDSSGSLQRGPR